MVRRLGGDLSLEIQDSTGVVIATGVAVTGGQRVVIPVVSQETYYVHVTNSAGGQSTYSLELENFAAPVPTIIRLNPADDTGNSNLDYVTQTTAPRFLIQADLQRFAAGMTIDPAAGAAGFDVELVVTDDAGNEVVTNATRLGTSSLWTVTSGAIAGNNVHLVAARVVVTDGQDTAVTDAGQLSAPVMLITDNLAPDGTTLAMAYYSDTGIPGDGITRQRQPAFTGVAEANATVRLFATRGADGPTLIGTTVAGSDASDGILGDGLGLWEITSEPLDDGAYTIAVEAEDAAGNVSPQVVLTPTLTIASAVLPQRPGIDLVDADDTGSSDLDNVTIGGPAAGDGVLQFRVTSDPNTTVDIKDGDIVVATVAVGATGEALVTLDFNALSAAPPAGTGYPAQGPHPLSAEATDAAGNLSVQSETLLVTVDFTPPLLPAVETFDLVTAADSFDPVLPGTGPSLGTDADDITAVRQPTFRGLAEANATIRIYANGQLVGEGIVQSDESDGINTDGFGWWQVTIGHLADGLYNLTYEVEDLAGNLVAVDPALAQTDLIIDTLAPQRPTLDLVDLPSATGDDSGRSDLDNVTFRTNDVPLTLTAEAGQPGAGQGRRNRAPRLDLAGGRHHHDGALTLGEGTHLLSVEAFDAAGNRSAQSEELVVTIDRTLPVVLAAPDLLAGSDSGSSSTDNVTNVQQPAFRGVGEANARVRVFAEKIISGVPGGTGIGRPGCGRLGSHGRRRGRRSGSLGSHRHVAGGRPLQHHRRNTRTWRATSARDRPPWRSNWIPCSPIRPCWI